MKLDDLGIDGRIVEKLRADGIEELYPPQAQAVAPALAGRNLVLSIPTASGKSLVAYLAILHSVLRGGKALYIVPLKALASEKYEDLAKFADLGIKVGESTGDYDDIDPKLSTYDIVIATSEKVDSLLRHRTKWLKQITVVVADEVATVSTAEAKAMSRRLAREEALFVGTSSGANVVAALREAQRLGPGGTVVTLLCDSGLKYLTTDLYAVPGGA